MRLLTKSNPHSSPAKRALLETTRREKAHWAAETPGELCFPQLFEAQVARTPDAVAVVFGTDQLTFRELNTRANQFAYYLQQRGVGAETLVGLCVERSPEMVIALLGILKAGGAYLPLDPTYPAERLAYMLADSQAPVLVTQTSLLPHLPPSQSPVICLDRDQADIYRESARNPVRTTTAADLAYVIYTSGSTGRPKGAMIEHGGLTNYLMWCLDAYPVQAGTGSIVHSSISFDLTITSLFAPLLAGRRLILTPEALGIEALSSVFRQERDLSFIKITPAHLKLLGEQLRPEEAAGRTHAFVIGGENLTAEHIRFWREHAPDTILFNEYGPTETVVGCCVYEIPLDQHLTGVIPIGRPIYNTHLYLLDEMQQPVPDGEAGELYIGGVCVGRGYWQRAELTAEKFIKFTVHSSQFTVDGSQFTGLSPANCEPRTANRELRTANSLRLYRTGDLCRRLPDGNLEFIGRIDGQIKVRGHRIELGEIEAVLTTHPAVRECVITAWEEVPGDKRLAAYYVPQPHQQVMPRALREFLQQQLPGYMVPATFVRLAAFPLSPNGKVDRRQLPAPDSITQERETELVPPADEIETRLKAIWEDVLRIQPISVTDNFFDLGGHSLLAVRVFWAMEKAFGQRLPLITLFQSPTIRQLAKLLRAENNPAQAATAIVPRRVEAIAPLTVNQESLWFFEQLNPATAAYNLYEALRLRGPLDVSALQATLDTIIARHEALRTTIDAIDGEPQQIIHAPCAAEIERIDLSLHPDGKTEALRLLRQAAEQPFDLTRPPLVRFTLLKLQEGESIFFVLLHHILSDGWSLGVFWREFAQVYESFAQGQSPALAPLPIQFGDYALWQRQQSDAGLAYWQQQLAGAPALLELPTDRPRPAVQRFHGAQQSLLLPDQLRRELKSFSQRQGTTLFMTLLAAFNALLARYTGQEDIVLGAPLAGRSQSETENLIGLFANVVALRTDLSGDPSFQTLLEKTKKTVLDALSHSSVPFEKLVAELQPDRSLSYNPIFQTSFALQNDIRSELKITGVELNPANVGSVRAKFDLFLALCETPAGLYATIEYNTDLFDAATMQRLLRHYQNLLEGVVADATQRISALPLLSEAELRQVLIEWNDTATDYPRDLCIHQLFEAQAARTPDAIAVVFGRAQLTFRELNQRANQVAHYLRAQGIKPDTLVGIFTDRSLFMVIGVLGILKAGGAYLPLDPSYPQARLQFMLEDAQATLVLTQQTMLSQLPETTANVICLDTHWNDIAQYSQANPINLTQPDHLAYVIYTSGSTGQPKGTAVVHRAVNRLVCNTNYVQLDETDCIAQVSNVSFDAATFELWGALQHGAKLILLNKDIALSPQEFAAQLREQKVTTLFVTTALFNLLSREAPTAFSTLKTVLFGGEACDPNAVREVLKNGPPERLLHVYGPTENTTFSSWHQIEQVPRTATTIPIGRPISNSTMYLLDRHLNPIPVGVHGEIFVGGDGLAREYLRQPALTEEKFISIADCGLRTAELAKNPQSAIRNPQLYRTGDIARYLPDGSIEFLGRKDQQIKLRGFRIELGEIEAALLAHPGVQDCVLVVTTGHDQNRRLLAYYTVTQEASPTARELRDFLKDRLPDYMLPALFFPLAEMPLTPNGKVDRQKLPAPEALQPASSTELVPAKDEVEAQLKRIWEEVLEVQPISVRENFFDLGGHSLIAVRLFTAIEKAFGQRLPLATLFQFPTIEQLADAIRQLRQAGWQSARQSVVALRAAGTRPPFFCVHAVGGNVLEYNDLARYFDPDQPFYGLQSVGLDGKQEPLTSVEEMAAHYLREMRQIQPHGPYYLGGRSFGGVVAYEMAQQLCAQGEEVRLLAMLDTYPLGWLKLFSAKEARQYKKRFLRLRIKQHIGNLNALGLTDTLHYIFNKIEFKKRIYKNLWWRLRRHFGSQKTTSLACTLRNIEELNFLAAKKYTPNVYLGAVTFFCAAEEVSLGESTFGWQQLAADGLEIVRVPGDHQTMIQEPHVQVLAKQLMERLARNPIV